MSADGGEEKSKFRWLDAARYAVATTVTVLIMAVIVNAVKLVLRPAGSLQLSVDKGSIFVMTQSPAPQLEQAALRMVRMEIKLRAQNPSDRVRMMYYVSITMYLFDNKTLASASVDPGFDSICYINLKDMAVDQWEAVDIFLMLTVNRKQMKPSYFDTLYNGSRISDKMLRLDGDLITEVTSGFNITRRTTYYCEEILVGGKRDDEAFKYRQDAICNQRRALN